MANVFFTGFFMSLIDVANIDMVIRLPGEPLRAALIIYDGGEIVSELEREQALQSKLAAYLMFVETGQFAEAYSALADAEISVEVVCSVAPSDGMRLIGGTRGSERSDLFMPVNVSEEAEFREKLGLSK